MMYKIEFSSILFIYFMWILEILIPCLLSNFILTLLISGIFFIVLDLEESMLPRV